MSCVRAARIPCTCTVDVEPARVLVFASPAGFEHFALELGGQARGSIPPADLAMPSAGLLAAVAGRPGAPRSPAQAIPRPRAGCDQAGRSS